MSKKNYYQVLQVDREASTEVIEAAYRRLARIYHPDVNKAPDATEIMRDLNVAYETLKNPAKRSDYDARLEVESQSARQPASPRPTYSEQDAASKSYESNYRKPGPRSRLSEPTAEEAVWLTQLLQPVISKHGGARANPQAAQETLDIIKARLPATPNNRTLLFMLANYCLLLHDPQNCVVYADDGLRIDENDWRLRYHFGMGYFNLALARLLDSPRYWATPQMEMPREMRRDLLEKYRADLDTMGMKPEEAAEEAGDMLQKLLRLRLTPAERDEITTPLNMLFGVYPDLPERIQFSPENARPWESPQANPDGVVSMGRQTATRANTTTRSSSPFALFGCSTWLIIGGLIYGAYLGLTSYERNTRMTDALAPSTPTAQVRAPVADSVATSRPIPPTAVVESTATPTDLVTPLPTDTAVPVVAESPDALADDTAKTVVAIDGTGGLTVTYPSDFTIADNVEGSLIITRSNDWLGIYRASIGMDIGEILLDASITESPKSSMATGLENILIERMAGSGMELTTKRANRTSIGGHQSVSGGVNYDVRDSDSKALSARGFAIEFVCGKQELCILDFVTLDGRKLETVDYEMLDDIAGSVFTPPLD